MDSEAHKALDAESRRTTLSRLAAYLETQRDAVTEQWLLAVRRDPNIATADRLTHQQLLDHLPDIYRECCQFLRRRDSSALIEDAQAEAKEHGEFRWQNGYRIDELIRELESFRRILAATVLRFIDVEPQFAGTPERQASALVHQFFSEVTVNSVKQFVTEQQAVVGSYTEKLQAANLELAQINSTLQQALSERHRMTSVVVHELRNLLQGLSMIARIWDDQQPQVDDASSWVRDQIHDLEHLLLQLLHQSNMADAEKMQANQVDLAALHAQLMQRYQQGAINKGLRLQGEINVIPLQIVADSAKLRLLAEGLLSHAIAQTVQGTVTLSFNGYDAHRWVMCVSDTGPGLSSAATEQLFGVMGTPIEAPVRVGTRLAITRGLVASLGGSLQVTTQAGFGTSIEVILPRASSEAALPP